jgi:hypothetical protein
MLDMPSTTTASTDPVVVSLTSLEHRARVLQSDLEEARNAESAARDAAVRLEHDLVRTTKALDVLRELAGVKPDAPRRTRAVIKPAAAATGQLLVAGIHGAAAAASRELAVLTLIAGGTTRTADIREAMTKSPAFSAEQHRASVANALSRLKAQRGFITKDGGVWALTAKGRKHLTTVKEAP